MAARATFTRQAMAATFRITIASDEVAYARQAAAEAFAELDRIEARLSRFVEGSDIWRVNRLSAGQATFVHHDTLECLRLAEEIRRDTAGAFDIAYASTLLVTLPRFQLDEDTHTVRVLTDGLRLDLGGIGKGFALDRMAALLREWGLTSALLCASTSTLLALNPPPGEEGWAAELGPDHATRRLMLANQALSASGIGAKGGHIMDPRTGRPAEGRLRAWATAPTAALADALSTAFLVMADAELRAYCDGHPAAFCHLTATPQPSSGPSLRPAAIGQSARRR